MSTEARRSQPSQYTLDTLSEFQDTAYQTFTTALDRYIDNGLPPGLDGKPVNLLHFSVERKVEEFSSSPINEETLAMYVQKPFQVEDFAKAPFSLFRRLSRDEETQHKLLVQNVNDTRLRQKFSEHKLIPAQAMWAGYNATRMTDRVGGIKGTDLNLSTYEVPRSNDEFEVASTMSQALFFARDALAYVSSSHFDKQGREMRPATYMPGSMGDAAIESMRHGLQLAMTPNLAPFLNGREDPQFLRQYQQEMIFKREEARKNLDQKLAMPEDFGNEQVAIANDIFEQYSTALSQVNELLEQ